MVSDSSVPWGELALSGCCVVERRHTCEDVLAQSGRAAILAIVEVLGGGGALEVLNGQAVAQDVWLQVRTRAELPTTNTQTHTRFVEGHDRWFGASSTWSCCATLGENKASLL